MVAVFAPTALCLERALPVLERPEPGLLAISRRGGADVPPENAREVALVGEARAGRDLGQRRFASGELGRRPGQPQPASVLPHRQPVVSAKRARQVRGMDTDPLGQLAETDPIREPSPQQLLRGAKPGRRPGVRALDPSLPRGRGEQLEREPLGRERRRRVLRAELAREPPRERAELAPVELGDAVEAAGERVGRAARAARRCGRSSRRAGRTRCAA